MPEGGSAGGQHAVHRWIVGCGDVRKVGVIPDPQHGGGNPAPFVGFVAPSVAAMISLILLPLFGTAWL